MTTDHIAAFGLALDIVGAILLAKGFVLKRIGAIVRESETYWGYNSHLRDSLIEQTIEARIGMAFLVLGFLAQLAPYIGRLAPSKFLVLAGLAVALLTASTVASHLLSRHRIEMLKRRQVLKEITQQPSDYKVSEVELQRFETLSNIQRLPGETAEQTVSRIKQALEQLVP